MARRCAFGERVRVLAFGIESRMRAAIPFSCSGVMSGTWVAPSAGSESTITRRPTLPG